MTLTEPSVDPPEDAGTANAAPWASHVLHVYNDDYLGIRAAASGLPGHKLVLPRQYWSREMLEPCHDAMRRLGVSRIVFHGISTAIVALARYLNWKAPRLLLFGVYHGNVSQWNDVGERAAAREFLSLDAEGVYFRSHILKPGADLLLRSPAPTALVNCAPREGFYRPARGRGIALAPVPDIWRKNLYANAVAAELAGSVEVVLHYAELADCPFAITKSRRLTYRNRESHRDVLRACDLVLNVTIVDCHPMVDLEANSLGRLSLHADYGMGVLQDHPAERLQTIKDPTDINQIRAGIENALAVPPERACEFVRDFARAMTDESTQRYAQFLDLEQR